jgi:hypothetical protein
MPRPVRDVAFFLILTYANGKFITTFGPRGECVDCCGPSLMLFCQGIRKESDWKLVLSRHLVCVLGPFLPFSSPRTVQNNIAFRRRDPDGFKDLCWWFAVFHGRAGIG